MITPEQNICRVFEMPEEYPPDYYKKGGSATISRLVTVFEPMPKEHIGTALLKSWEEYYLPIIRDFLEESSRLITGKRYVGITDFNKSFVFVKK